MARPQAQTQAHEGIIARVSLRTRLILVVVALLLGGFAGTSAISYETSARALRRVILHRELPLTGSNIYSEIQADLVRPVLISSQMATDTFVKDWLLEGEVHPGQITRYLAAIQARYHVTTAYLISAKTLRYYHFLGNDRTLSPSNPDDVWFWNVQAITAPYDINIDYDEAANRTLTIFVNYKVFDYQGRFIGVTGVGLTVDTVKRIVESYRNDFQRNVYFVKPDGTIMLESARGAGLPDGNIRLLPGIRAIAPAILSHKEGQFTYRRPGGTFLLETRFIPQLGWYVMVERSEGAALSGLWRSFIANLIIGAAIILLTAGAVAYVISAYQRRLEVMATIDPLTGLCNRQVFDLAIARAIASRRRFGGPFALMLLDVDRFKEVNDTLGHLRGDVVLKRIAMVAGKNLRSTDLICRWGGEELVVLAYDCTLADAARMAEGLRAAIAEAPMQDPDDGSRITVSIGITDGRAGDDVDAVLHRADRALYSAKAAGRNRVMAASA